MQVSAKYVCLLSLFQISPIYTFIFIVFTTAYSNYQSGSNFERSFPDDLDDFQRNS